MNKKGQVAAFAIIGIIIAVIIILLIYKDVQKVFIISRLPTMQKQKRIRLF